MNVLTMKNVKKSFGDVEVLRDISLTVEEGQVLAIIGPSGSGKSTFLREKGFLTESLESDAVYESKGGRIMYMAYDGHLAAKFYIPLIQIAYSDAGSALPLVLVSDSNDLFRLLMVVGAVMLLCMVILGWLISKLKITQALKLGED